MKLSELIKGLNVNEPHLVDIVVVATGTKQYYTVRGLQLIAVEETADKDAATFILHAHTDIATIDKLIG